MHTADRTPRGHRIGGFIAVSREGARVRPETRPLSAP